MKKYLFILLILALAACDKNDDGGQDNPIISTDYIRVAPNLQLLGDGQVEELAIEANCNWTITKNQDWLTVTPMSGSNSQRVKVSAGRNAMGAERSAILTITGGTAPERHVMVTQAKATETVETKSLSVSPESLDFDADGGSKSFTITSNTTWTISGTPNWCKISQSSGTGTTDVTITAQPNPDKQQRSGEITISIDTKDAKLTLTQEANKKEEKEVPDQDDNQPPT